MKKTALIMAGGRGERFWPRSRTNCPKQFLSLTNDGKTMIQLTVERILAMVDIEDIYVATNQNYRDLVIEQLPNIPKENILCEPIGRNTAPCIGLGAMHIQKKYSEALMMVLPADHLIKQVPMFLQTLGDACTVAETNSNLVTIGITPTYPETGYGYIKFQPEETAGRAFAVDRFVEKPDAETAANYLESEQYLWNSGMFVWKISSILENIKKFMPQMHTGLQVIADAIGTDAEHTVLTEEFYKFRSESVDYGIMEKAQDIFILPGTFGWDDVGNWNALDRINPTNEFGNMIQGNVVSVDTKNTIISGQKKLIATVGVKNLVIIETDDVILICDKDATQDVKRVVENLKICNRHEYI